MSTEDNSVVVEESVDPMPLSLKRKRSDESRSDSEDSFEDEMNFTNEDAPLDRIRSLIQLREKELNNRSNDTPRKRIKRDWFDLLDRSLQIREGSIYKKMGPLGEGSFSRVYVAKHQETEELVAIKKLNFDKEGTPLAHYREIYTLMMAKHKNILQLKEVVKTPYSQLVLVTELCSFDLYSFQRKRKKTFETKYIKDFMHQLLEALNYLHELNIIHRDVKLSNCLLDSNGVLKLADFGLAREINPRAAENHTPLVVTLWYRPPELFLGCRTYTFGVDIWSAGCVFAELLLGKPLFGARTEIGQLTEIFKKFGTPNDDVWEGFSELPLCKTLVWNNSPPVDWKANIFSNIATQTELDMLGEMLVLDPKKRKSPQTLLKDKFFKEEPIREAFIPGNEQLNEEDDEESELSEEEEEEREKANTEEVNEEGGLSHKQTVNSSRVDLDPAILQSCQFNLDFLDNETEI